MAKTINRSATDYIARLNINGLEGRQLHLPAPKNPKRQRNILLIYGHHAMLERWWGLVENLNDYGSVTMPDMPGFGGMDSFYKIKRKPTIDQYADYLAAYVKLRFKRKRITIVAISFGFVVVTRMLQKYPELAQKVDLIVSEVGFMHHDDFVYSARSKRLFRFLTRLFGTRIVSWIIRYTCLNKPVLKYLYTRMPNSKKRMIEITPEQFEESIDLEVKMWQANDVRTHWITNNEFLSLDNCQYKIDLPIHHVVSANDHYFDNETVKQHMLVVFNGYRQYTMNSKAHTPSVIADKKGTAVMLPTGLRRVLARP